MTEKNHIVQGLAFQVPQDSVLASLSDVRMFRLLADGPNGDWLTIHSRLTPPVALFNQLASGALVIGKRDELNRLVELTSVSAPLQGQVTGYNFQRQAYTISSKGRGPVYVGANNVAQIRGGESLSLGAHVTFHTNEAGRPHHVMVQKEWAPTALWRVLSRPVTQFPIISQHVARAILTAQMKLGKLKAAVGADRQPPSP